MCPRSPLQAESVCKTSGDHHVKSWSVCWSVLVVWTLVIKQMTHGLIIILIILLLYGNGSSQGLDHKDTQEASLPVYRVTEAEAAGAGAPHFVTVQQLVEVLEHDTAVLECRVTNIDEAVTVSWLRWADMSVLTVGGLVFSSDPRLVVAAARLGPATLAWKLYISEVSPADSGDYQCQINTEPKQSLDVTLMVSEEDSAELFSVFAADNSDKIKQQERHKFVSSTPAEILTSTYSGEIIEPGAVPAPVNIHEVDTDKVDISHQIDDAEKKYIDISGSAGDGSKERSIFSVLQQTYVSVDRTQPNIESEDEETAEFSSQVDTFEGSELEKVLRESAAKTEAAGAGGEGGRGRGGGGAEPPQSLLLPVLLLSVIVTITLALALSRLIYTKMYKDKQEKTLSRPQSRLSTSRRGSGWRPGCYLDTLDREQRLEGGGLYDSRKPRLSPLIEVIEPTPPLCRSTPIFGLTDLDDSDFELDLSDSASNISEAPCRSPLSSLTRHKPSLVPEVAVVSSASEHRKLRNKIIDNVNTFL